ncbi:MAG: glycerophosphodiester phosphodiesterase, partial [Acidimicrobiales bacterium]
MTEVFAHRGAHRIERENTLGAFRVANDLGVDGVELDVRRTADGTLVIRHDPTIDGRAIALIEAAELPPYVAHFDEAMV